MALMALGTFVFEIRTIPFNDIKRQYNYRHSKTERVGARAVSQFVGIGDDTVSFSCVLYPGVTGGIKEIEELKKMAAEGLPLPLLNGRHEFIGEYIIKSIDITEKYLFQDGAAKAIDFSISLDRVDDEEEDNDGI